ncbi:glycoside hydrolase family 25 protein [Paenibacillus glycanilyticus]|uniref:glycoside hydrolase family 25 protein n=1 Tax=Paenibacillus glycanilyticus TaxID=126569 RepID=UPI002041E0B1|nr:glycoside hydrolase family 25 protein [Paenibacillus glycanilyticus]MCM3629631.1 glycoside hydrolase family 25 protein [Paenibacillus glycanilyticus]
MKLKRWQTLSAAMLLLVLIAGVLEYKGIIWHNSLFAAKYKIRGIDVSHYQGEINWDKVAGSGKWRFVYIKATEGKDMTDDYFKSNWEQARSNGMLTGAYHFFTTQSTGAEQAAHFIEKVPNEAAALPPVIDIEIALDKNVPLIQRELTALSAQLEQHYKQRPILYVTYDTFHAYIAGSFNDHEIWIRDVVRHPGLRNDRPWIFWQYNNRGHIAGIDAYVDINVFKGDEAAFNARFKSRQ